MTEPESTESGGGGDAEAVPEEPTGEDEQGEQAPPEPGVTAGDTDGDPLAEGTVDDELLDRVDALETRTVAREIATLELRVQSLEEELAAHNEELTAREEELEEVRSKLKRKQADFENYKKRMEERKAEEQRRTRERLLERFLDVRDNLERAVEQDEDVDIREGVESTLRQFDDQLDAEGVERIAPEPGGEVDPHRHEVLARVEAETPADTVADVHRPGYAMGESVLREAQVTVSDGPDNGGEDDVSDEGSDEGGDDDVENQPEAEAGADEAGNAETDADAAPGE